MAEDQATFDYADERFSSPRKAVAYWKAALDAAEEEEKDWTLRAEKAAKLYDATESGQQSFNILHANAQTALSASYNSTPLPDVRPKFLQGDEQARFIGELMERGISHQLDVGDFDAQVEQAVLQGYVAGRGVARVRYHPYMHTDTDQNERLVFEEALVELVDWQDFRRGPGKVWGQVPWLAFRQKMSRDDVLGLLDPDGTADAEALEGILDRIPFDLVSENRKLDREKGDQDRDITGRAEVWEVWDKEARLIWFVCESYTDAPLAVEADPFELPGFFPIPKPLVYGTELSSLTPICPYTTYQAQAEELEKTSERIRQLTECLKWRGIRASEIQELDDLPSKEDGEFTPSVNAMAILQGGKSLADAIWVMPIDKLIAVLRELVQIRETQKQVIYEITGMADIMRGQTDPRETKGAQEIKAQWGSLRIQRFQREVQRFCRDLFRIMAHIIGNIFSEQTITVLNGEPLPDGAMQALRSDLLRHMRVDVETDSTIRGDLNRIQSEQSNFLNATGQFIQAVAPVIKTPENPVGFLPPQAAVDIFTAFARSFRLGRQVEDTLAQMSQMAREQPQEQGPDPAQQEAEAKAQETQMKLQAEQQKMQLEQQKAQQQAEIDRADLAFRREEQEQEFQNARRKLALEAEKLALEERKLEIEAQRMRETEGV